MHRGRNRRTRGSMMLEVVMASALAVIVLALLVSTQIHVLRNYQRTINHNTANRAAYNALREIREIAQQAVSVTVTGQHGDYPAAPARRQRAVPHTDSARHGESCLPCR
jgi:Tfp pilus assembly protein PilW